MNHPKQPGHARRDEEQGILIALLNRLTSQRLPRLLDLKTKVTRGERLDSFDIHFLHEVLEDAKAQQARWADHAEFTDIIAKVTQLYHEITERALANEEDAGTTHQPSD
ncbi:hypothetical protein CKO25_08365 [Thiocapsa imhoffii]|uniref:Uncharacterized protein n=1 Tax=Thiocapsa imhoffii TaxID=382777 RepID=A0A9X0WHG5_9GAMM|nr:hypothetical protein [Thiocapsa imhoffii]